MMQLPAVAAAAQSIGILNGIGITVGLDKAW